MIVNEQPIVITGASSGIGKATAMHLDELGFRVFAGVRKEVDGRRLMKNLARLPVSLRDQMLYNAIYARRRS